MNQVLLSCLFDHEICLNITQSSSLKGENVNIQILNDDECDDGCNNDDDCDDDYNDNDDDDNSNDDVCNNDDKDEDDYKDDDDYNPDVLVTMIMMIMM